MSRRGQWTIIVLIGLVVIVALAAQGTFAPPSIVPTLMVLAPTGAIINPPTATTEPTPDFEALDATSAAISPPVATALAALPDVQGITSVSAMVFKDGVSLSIYAAIANADDNEDTMGRLYDAVRRTVDGEISQIHVTTTVGGIPQRNWLWEDGVWSWASLVTPTRARVMPTARPTAKSQSSGVSCGGASTCGEMASCQQAYACLRAGNERLDRDGDGVPCESICG